jgi:hypothetical protein
VDIPERFPGDRRSRYASATDREAGVIRGVRRWYFDPDCHQRDAPSVFDPLLSQPADGNVLTGTRRDDSSTRSVNDIPGYRFGRVRRTTVSEFGL